MQLYSLESIPYYDSINQSYRNILSINKAPIGPLKDITRNIKLNKLSPFDTHNNDYCRSSCVIGVTKIDNKNELMCVEETSDFFQFLCLYLGFRCHLLLHVLFHTLMKSDNL